MEENEITYCCKASLYPPATMIGILMGIGMPVLLLTIFIHPVVAGIAMLVSMYIAMQTMTGDTTFVMNTKGIQKTITVRLNLWKSKNPETESYEWHQLKWFKEGKDKGNYTPEYHFLRLHFMNGTEWMITDNNGERLPDFQNFLGAFKSFVMDYNQQQGSRTTPAGIVAKTKDSIGSPVGIEQRRTFYETAWAKLFTILLGLLIVFFIYLKITTPYLNTIATFRLILILIPGFFYMWYRVYREKK